MQLADDIQRQSLQDPLERASRGHVLPEHSDTDWHGEGSGPHHFHPGWGSTTLGSEVPVVLVKTSLGPYRGLRHSELGSASSCLSFHRRGMPAQRCCHICSLLLGLSHAGLPPPPVLPTPSSAASWRPQTRTQT